MAMYGNTNGNPNGHDGNDNGHTRQMIMAILAIIMAIDGKNGNNNGHAWQTIMAIYGNDNGHKWHNTKWHILMAINGNKCQ